MNGILFGNLFEKINENAKEEVFETIFERKDVRIERIISTGQSSPENFWYDQEENEFVALLKGSAQIKFIGGKIFDLKEGDWLLIPARVKHRVEKTDKKTPTVWLAFFFK